MNKFEAVILFSPDLSNPIMSKEEANYTSGKLNGSIIRWHENGNRSEEGTYETGKQNGIWIWYYDTGIKKEQTKYQND